MTGNTDGLEPLDTDGDTDANSGTDESGASMQTESDETPARRRMDRRTASLIFSGLTLVILVAVAAILPVPYVMLTPGPTFDTLGSFDGEQLVTITGATTFPTDGALKLTTVGESGGPYGKVSLAEAFWGWFNPSVAVLPERLLYPEKVDRGEVQQENSADFLDSQSQATAAALLYLKEPVEQVVQVRSVTVSGASNDILQPGDVIVEIDGQRPADANQAADIITAKKPGSVVEFDLTRDTKPTTAKVTTKVSPADPKKSVIGITVTDSFQGKDINVDYGLEQVGGPSAGLMFSLGIVDKLSKTSLTDGRTIAGTGTIDANGFVGPIGGVQQKVVGAKRDGADYFLTPTRNCIDAFRAAPKGLTLVRVETLSDAVAELDKIRTGKPTTPC